MLHPLLGIQGLPKPMKGKMFFFFWDGMKHDIYTFMDECDVCQCNKGETVKSPDTLQNLPLPPSVWVYLYGFHCGLPSIWKQDSHHGGG
jgi:hypothetical protein